MLGSVHEKCSVCICHLVDGREGQSSEADLRFPGLKDSSSFKKTLEIINLIYQEITVQRTEMPIPKASERQNCK
jgi:hypothetical protein